MSKLGHWYSWARLIKGCDVLSPGNALLCVSQSLVTRQVCQLLTLSLSVLACTLTMQVQVVFISHDSKACLYQKVPVGGGGGGGGIVVL